ncbi:hypothetical protein [Aestuariimicrobium kwangyangense]|uniref:hypothetical protein n=1 Tax=Aestuariimicrobium kwangyangense TaxID=396389 RepID=UPI0003B62EC2|nr:hypothetical protein [Aestuariimicrobium kwangyangense]
MSPAPRRRFVRLGMVASALAVVVLAGCVSTEVAQPYTPGVGVDAQAPGVHLRAITVVAKDGAGVLAGSVDSPTGDTLTGVAGQATGSNFEDTGALTVGSVNVELPAGKLVSLTQQKVALNSDKLQPGLYARITFTFAKAGEVTTLVPVVDASSPDYSSVPRA